MANSFLSGLTVKELLARAWKESNEDDVSGGAAELAYYFLLALFPMLIFLMSLVGFMPSLRLEILNGLAKVMPSDALYIVRDTIEDIVKNNSGGLLSFGILGTLWAASSGVVALIGTLNVAYETKETRSFWKVRAIALMITLFLCVLVIIGALVAVLGDGLSVWAQNHTGLTYIPTIWHWVKYPVGLFFLFVGIEIVYYLAPNIKHNWRWITPGGLFAAVFSILISVLLSLYLRFGPSYSVTYGSLGAVIILMLWLYLVGLVILIGGEINDEIRKAIHRSQSHDESPEKPKAA
ncbi:MAG TPA: YihY/virulence factor BrkB family protein [Blastocatellia bacterium]|nr:YihY/virulence factor BrkB family protein [Blastocatellia bacterium]